MCGENFKNKYKICCMQCIKLKLNFREIVRFVRFQMDLNKLDRKNFISQRFKKKKCNLKMVERFYFISISRMAVFLTLRAKNNLIFYLFSCLPQDKYHKKNVKNILI